MDNVQGGYNICVGVPQGLALNDNDITHNFKCGSKLFSDDRSLFTTVQNENAAANWQKLAYGHANRKCSLTLIRQRRLS